MSNNTRNIWLFSLFVVFYCSYWYWRLSDFYCPPFYSEEAPIETVKIDVASKVSSNPHINAEALGYIEKFQDINRMEESGEVEWEENIKNLVGMDYRAIPTILQQLNTPIDINYKKILLKVLEEINDPLVRKDLEDLLSTYDSDAQKEVVDTLLELKCTESIPALIELQKQTNDERLKSKIKYVLQDLNKTLIERGVYTELFKLLPIQINEPESFDRAIELLCLYPPIQSVLNCEENIYLDEKNKLLFVKAVNEWYYEQVLMQPSPYKTPVEFKFAEPFAYDKQKGWELLCAESNKNEKYSVLRVLPIDQDLTETDLNREITLITGYGHGHNLSVYNFKPNGTRVIIQEFTYRYGDKRTEFIGDSGKSIYKISESSLSEYKSLLAGLRIIFSASIFEWWNGSNIRGISRSSNDFVISITGLEKDPFASVGFCGYPSSNNRIESMKLIAARNLVNEFTNNKNLEPLYELPDLVLFSKIFLMTKEKMSLDGWWWVRERMLSLAYDFGDKSLIASLASFLEKEFVGGKSSMQRTASNAINALAEITKQEFRFGNDGSPKSIEIVAKEYLDYLGVISK